MAGGFDSLGLMPELLRSVEEMDWLLPTDIQDEVIPLILGGGDVMAAAETGSGKTGAFSLPMLQCVYERLHAASSSSSSSSSGAQGSGGDDRAAMEVDADITVSICQNDKDNMVLVSSDGKQAFGQAEKQWTGGRATHGAKNGRYYYEATITSKGICRFGFSTMAAHTELGRDTHGFGYGGTGMKSHKNAFEKYGEQYGEGDTIGCYLDLDESNPRIVFSKNGNVLGEAFKLDKNVRKMALFPAYVLKGAKANINFGQEPFKYQLAAGFSGFCGESTKAAGCNNDIKSDLIAGSSVEAYSMDGVRSPMAIILEPARDLAEQVYNNVCDMSKYVTNPELKSLLVVGGDESKHLKKALNEGIDIVVGTIGKVIDMFKSGALSLAQVKFFILDEADRMVDDAQNLQSIMQLYAACPAGGTGDNRLQVCFFSATLHSDAIKNLAAKICVNPTWVDLKGVESVPETVHHVVYRVHPFPREIALWFKNKSAAVRYAHTDSVHEEGGHGSSEADQASQEIKQWKLQALLKIVDAFDMSQAILFCRTNVDCNNLEAFFVRARRRPKVPWPSRKRERAQVQLLRIGWYALHA